MFARGLLRKGAYDRDGAEIDRCIDVALVVLASENPDVSEVGLAKGEKGRFCDRDIPLPAGDDVQTTVSSGS
jgi:hypothetical protein